MLVGVFWNILLYDLKNFHYLPKFSVLSCISLNIGNYYFKGQYLEFLSASYLPPSLSSSWFFVHILSFHVPGIFYCVPDIVFVRFFLFEKSED